MRRRRRRRRQGYGGLGRKWGGMEWVGWVGAVGGWVGGCVCGWVAILPSSNICSAAGCGDLYTTSGGGLEATICKSILPFFVIHALLRSRPGRPIYNLWGCSWCQICIRVLQFLYASTISSTPGQADPPQLAAETYIIQPLGLQGEVAMTAFGVEGRGSPQHKKQEQACGGNQADSN